MFQINTVKRRKTQLFFKSKQRQTTQMSCYSFYSENNVKRHKTLLFFRINRFLVKTCLAPLIFTSGIQKVINQRQTTHSTVKQDRTRQNKTKQDKTRQKYVEQRKTM